MKESLKVVGSNHQRRWYPRRLEASCLPLDDHRDLHDSFLALGASILAKRQAPYLALTYLL